MNISKDKIVVIFYILYFTWLLMITYLTRNVLVLNYFSLAVTIFYFLLLREKNDFLLFLAAGSASIFLTFFAMNTRSLPVNFFDLNTVPIWLPLAWGITVVSLKKFGYMMIYD